MNAPVKPASRAERVQKIRTASGVEAWLVEDYAVPLVALEFSFKGGTTQDAPGKGGAAAMLAGMLDEGAGDLDAAAFHRAIDDKAIHLSFNADRDNFSGRMQSLSRHLDRAFELLALAVGRPRFDDEPIEQVRGQLIAMLKREIKDPDAMAMRTWRGAAYPGHPYARNGNGELGEIETVTREDLISLRAKIFARDTLKVAVVGAIDGKTLAARLDQVFAALPQKSDLTPVAEVGVAGLGRREIVELDVPQATIRFGRSGLRRADPDFIAASVVNHILGGGAFTARLFQEVREKRGLAYSVYSMLTTADASPLFVGATSTKNERAGESLGVIEAEFARLAAEGPSADELEKAKKYLIGSYALRFDTSTKIAGHLLQLQREGFEPDYLDRRNEEIAAVTLEDARRVAKKLIGDGKLLVAVVGKPKGLETTPAPSA